MRHGVSSGGRRRVRVHGRRAAAAARRAPRDRGRARHRRLQRGRGGAPTSTRRSRAAYGDLTYAPRATPPTSPGSTSCSSRCRTASRSGSCPALVDTVGHVVDLGADFRLPADVYDAVVRRAARRARAARPVRVRAASSCSATRSRRTRTSPRPGCYPTAAALALAPLVADGLVEPHGHRGRRGVGRLGRGPRAQGHEPVLRGATRTSCAYGLLTHRHTGEMEQALDARRPGTPVAGAVHAAPRADDARHPRHLLRPPGGRRPVDRAAARRTYREFYADEPFVRRGRRAAGDQGDARRERRATSPCASTRAPAPCSRSARDGQPREGRVGPGDPGRQPRARPARDDRPRRSIGTCHDRERERA